MYRFLLIVIFFRLPLEAAAGELPDPAPSAMETSHIDYGAIGATVRDIARENPARSESVEAASYTQTERFGREAAKGERKDCKTAYAGLSLLAIPFLLFDTLTDKGCKW